MREKIFLYFQNQAFFTKEQRETSNQETIREAMLELALNFTNFFRKKLPELWISEFFESKFVNPKTQVWYSIREENSLKFVQYFTIIELELAEGFSEDLEISRDDLEGVVSIFSIFVSGLLLASCFVQFAKNEQELLNIKNKMDFDNNFQLCFDSRQVRPKVLTFFNTVP